MKRLREMTLAMALLATAALAGRASASVILTFDNLPNPGFGTPIANGYTGLNWTNFYAINTTTEGFSDGITHGVVSPTNVAYNGFGNTAIASSSSPFIFNSADFTAAWNNGLTVHIDGYLASSLVQHADFVIDTTAPQLQSFNWTVDRLDFSSSGGTSAGFTNGSGPQFVLDNMLLNDPVSAPEPASLLVIAAGAACLLSRRRAR